MSTNRISLYENYKNLTNPQNDQKVAIANAGSSDLFSWINEKLKGFETKFYGRVESAYSNLEKRFQTLKDEISEL